MDSTTIADLTITTAKLGGRALTVGKVRQLDFAAPDAPGFVAVARYSDPKSHYAITTVIGTLAGQTVRSAVFKEDRPHGMERPRRQDLIRPDLHAAWADLPLVLL